MVSEATMSDDNAIREIRAAIKSQAGWRYVVRRVLAGVRETAWREGYSAGQKDAYDEVAESEPKPVPSSAALGVRTEEDAQ